MNQNRMLALLLSAVTLTACSGSADEKPAADTAAPEMVIDTAVATIMGYAVKLQPNSWCLVTSRRDMWNGKPVSVILMKEAKVHAAYVRDTLMSCAPMDSTPGTLSFALEMKYPPVDSGTIGIVLRDDVYGGLRRGSFTYETNLDGIEGKEFVQECVGASSLNLFATSDSANGPIRWQHKVPLRDEFAEGRPHCDGRLGEPRAPAQAVAEAPARPKGIIVFPDTRNVDPGVRAYDLKAIRRVGNNQLEVLEAAAVDMITEPACPGGVAGRGMRPQINGEWIVMIKGVYPVRETISSAPRIIGTGPRRLIGDSVVVLMNGPPLVIRSERIGEAGFALYTQVMGARSTLYASDFLPAGSWQVPLAVDYDGDGSPDILVSITSASGTESRFYISTQRQLMGGMWPAAAELSVPAC